MTTERDVPVDLYVAAYSDPDAARKDWHDIVHQAGNRPIAFEGLALVSRDADGKIHEQDDADTVGVGTVPGAASGVLVGLIFPPALLESTAAGAGVGAGTAGLVSHHDKKEIKAEVANDVPVGSSGIAVLFDDARVLEVEKSLSRADSISKHQVDRDSVDQAKSGAAMSVVRR